MAFPTVVQTAQNQNGSGSTSLTLTYDQLPTANNLMIAAIAVRGGSGVTITPPTGRTLVRRLNQGTTLSLALYSRVYETGATQSYTWTFSASQKASGGIREIMGQHAVTPIAVENGGVNPSSTTHTTVSVTPATPNDYIALASFATAVGTTATPSANWSEGYVQSTTGGSGATRTTSEGQSREWSSGALSGSVRWGASALGVSHIMLIAPSPPTTNTTLDVSDSGTLLTTEQSDVTLTQSFVTYDDTPFFDTSLETFDVITEAMLEAAYDDSGLLSDSFSFDFQTEQTLTDVALLTPVEAWQESTNSAVLLSDSVQLIVGESHEQTIAQSHTDTGDVSSLGDYFSVAQFLLSDEALVIASETFNTDDSENTSLADTLSFSVSETATIETSAELIDTASINSSEMIAMTLATMFEESVTFNVFESYEETGQEEDASVDEVLLSAEESFVITFSDTALADVGKLNVMPEHMMNLRASTHDLEIYDALGDSTTDDGGTVGADETLYFSKEVSFDDTATLSSFEMLGSIDTTFKDNEYKMHNVLVEYVFIRRGKTYGLMAAHPQYEIIERGPTYELQEGSMEYTFIRHDD